MKNYSLNTLRKDDFHKTLIIEDRLSLALQSAGFKPVVLTGFSDDFITWQNTKTGENAILDGWYGIQDYLEEHINNLDLSDLQKEKIKFLIDDKYIHNPHTLNNPLKMVDVIAHYEIDNNIPENDRLTNWFGDNSMYEPKLGVTGSQVKAKYMELKYSDLSLETLQSTTVADDEEHSQDPTADFSTGAKRYTYNTSEEPERLWNGKRIEDFTEEDKLQFLIETDLQINGFLSDNAKKALAENGYTYSNGVLTKDVNEINTPIAPTKESKKMDNKKYAAVENTQKEKLEKLNNQVKDIVESYKTKPENIAELLAFKEKFYKYSINNTMLVYDQNPNATFVQSFDAWKKDGYSVLKGQKGLKVLVPTNVTYLKVPGTDKLVQLSYAPDSLKDMYKAHNIESIQRKFFKVGNVFDISQTDVPKENYPEYYSMGYKDSDYDNIIAGISKYSKEKLNCPVTIKDLQSIALRGCYFPIDNTIELNNLLESSEKISTLTHELGHAVLHNDPELKISASQVEFEADCMSIMLESHFGIPLADTRKEHIATHYKKLSMELSTEDIEVDFKGILNDVFSKYESMIDDIDSYVSKEIVQEPEQIQVDEDYIPSGNLVNRMLERENMMLADDLDLAVEA